jgi:ABC-type transport system involved in multi-copper enzyme maturation permease subunit
MSTATIEPTTAESTGGAAPAPTLARLVRVELRKTYDTRAGFWLLLLVALASLAVVGLQLFFAEEQDKTFAAFFATTQLPVNLLLPVVGILLVTSEWSQRTAMTTFALVPARSRVLTAKVVVGVLVGLLGVAAAALASALGALLTPLLTTDGTDWDLSGGQLVQVALVQVLTILVGVAFGMLLLNSPLAIVLYFVLPTVVTIVSNTVGALTWVRDWLDLTTTTAPMFDGSLDGQGWAQLATSVALWGVVPMVAGWIRILRSEIG